MFLAFRWECWELFFVIPSLLQLLSFLIGFSLVIQEVLVSKVGLCSTILNCREVERGRWERGYKRLTTILSKSLHKTCLTIWKPSVMHLLHSTTSSLISHKLHPLWALLRADTWLVHKCCGESPSLFVVWTQISSHNLQDLLHLQNHKKPLPMVHERVLHMREPFIDSGGLKSIQWQTHSQFLGQADILCWFGHLWCWT